MALPAYLLLGPEIGERNDFVEKLRNQWKNQFPSLDEYNFYASETRPAEVLSILEGQGLFTDASFVLYKGVELLKKKEDIELIASWVKSAANTRPKSELIMLSDETSVEKKLMNIFPKENIKIFWEMYENRKQEWLRNLFRKNGLGIEEDAVEAILELVENNTASMRSACQPFFIFFEKNYTVTEKDVEKLLSHNKEESAFTLFDAMADSSPQEKRLEKSLEILQSILLSKSANAVSMLAGLSYCFKQLRVWHELHAQSYPSDFDLKIKGFSSSKAKQRYEAAARLWTYRQTLEALALLSKTDIEIRTDGNSLEETRLKILMYELIVKKGASCSHYEEDLDL